VGPDTLTLEVPAAKKSPEHSVSVDLGDVRKGTVQVEFKRSDHDEPEASDDSSDAEEES
jgi:ribosome maturation factor RimP